MKQIEKRRQKRLDKFENEKDLIATWKKKNRLYQGKRALNWVELPKPERRGYKRYFVLREDVAKSKEANFYRTILSFIQKTVLCRDKNYEYKDHTSKAKKPIMQYVKDIDLREWNKLVLENKLTPKMQMQFERKWKTTTPNRGHWVYEFKKPWVYAFKIAPHYITHRILINPQLESELRELENRIEKQNLMPKISKIMGWRNGYRDFSARRNKLIEDATDKMLRETLGDFTKYE
jgi:hypothetical protein